MFKRGVGTLIYHETKGILLIKRSQKANFQKNKWENVGGSVENNETFFSAAKREVSEELGEDSLNHLEFEKTSLLHWIEKSINGENEWETMLFMAFADDYFEPKIPRKEFEYISDAKWFEKNNIPWMELTTYTKEDFEKLKIENKFPFNQT